MLQNATIVQQELFHQEIVVLSVLSVQREVTPLSLKTLAVNSVPRAPTLLPPALSNATIVLPDIFHQGMEALNVQCVPPEVILIHLKTLSVNHAPRGLIPPLQGLLNATVVIRDFSPRKMAVQNVVHVHQEIFLWVTKTPSVILVHQEQYLRKEVLSVLSVMPQGD